MKSTISLVLILLTFNIYCQQLVNTVPRNKSYNLIYEEYNSGRFINYLKFEFVYNSKGKKTTHSRSKWRQNKWKYTSKEEYIFDNNDNPIRMEGYYFEPNSEIWIKSSIHESTYDSNGNQLSHIRYHWSATENKRTAFDRASHKYDLNNNQIERRYWLWDKDENKWNLQYKNITEYDNGNKALVIMHTWNGNDWVLSYKKEIKYGATNEILEFTISDWDSNTNQWETPRNKTVNEYDINNNLTSFKRSERFGFSWKDKFKQERTYDNNNNLIQIIDQETAFTTTWNNKYKRNTEFDTDGYETKLFEYKWDGREWKPSYRLTYEHYSTLAIDNIKKNIFNIYPIPAENRLNIDSNIPFNGVNIYDSSGQKLKDLTLDNTSLDISNLSSGVYFLNILFDNTTVVRKIIKK